MFPSYILNYQIIRQLGSGGMGQVFLAKNTSFDQLVAIKMLHPRLADNAMLREKFKKEAQLLSSLNHPNIVRFFNYVENDSGVFLIMEYVDGMTLEDFITKKNGLIVEKRALPMFNQILGAFSYAHSKNIVHLDIKPSNIFITPDGQIKILDFGIAKILSDSGSAGDGDNMVMGTPEYMSPEQVIGRNIDRRSDIYSLGVLFHQMLTGRPPYDTTTLSRMEIQQCVLNDALPKMKDYYPYISDSIQKVVTRATNKLPDKRYKDCAEMQRAVKKALDPEPVSKKKWIFAAIAGLILIAAGVTVWDYFRVKVSYYTDYTEVFGVPVGLGEVSSSDVEHRAQTYRMESSRRKVRRLTLVNSMGTPIDHSDSELKALRPADTRYFYTDEGRIDYKTVYDANGRLLYKLDFDENLKTASYKYDDEYGTPMRLGAKTTDVYADFSSSASNRSTITRQLLKFDDESGRLQQIIYADLNNTPRPDADNIYGMDFKYDDDGRITGITFLDADGNPRNNSFGLGAKAFSYDADGHLSRVKYLSADDSPATDGKNVSIVEYKYDDNGNVVSESYFGVDDMPVMRTDLGAFGLRYSYNEQGQRTRQTTVGPDGKPFANAYGYASLETEYDDELGLPVKEWYLDADDKRCNLDHEGDAYGGITYKLNERGLATSVTFTDTDDKPTATTAKGYATINFKYDDDGYPTETSYLGADGNPVAIDGMASVVKTEYDKLHREVRHTNFDADGNPVTNGDQIHGYTVEYDQHGNVTDISFIDDKSRPAMTKNLVATIKFTYDDKGNNTVREFLGTDAKPTNSTDGISRIETVYDSQSNLPVEVKYYSTAGLKESEITKYDPTGKPLQSYTLDAKGKLQGVVTNNEYDKTGHLTRSWATNLDGKRMTLPGESFAEVTYKYDIRGNVTEMAIFDISSQPAANALSIHRVTTTYNDRNRKESETFYGKDSQPVSKSTTAPEIHYKYDMRGNVVETTIHDGHGTAINGTDGVHRTATTYNDRNLVTGVENYDVNGVCVISASSGYAKYRAEYNQTGSLVAEKFYNTPDIMDYQVVYTYNGHNTIDEIKVLDADGQQYDKFNFSRIVVEYDSDGLTPVGRSGYTRGGTRVFHQKYNKTTGGYE